MKNIFFSVIIPAYNEEQHISECLTAIINQDYPKNAYEIIVVDNDSEDATKKIAQSFDICVVDHKTGAVGAVRNAGAKQARGNVLVFIDADCIAPPNWLSKGEELLNENNAVYGGGYILRDKPFWIEKAWLLENKCPPRELLGCCIFIEKSDFQHVGGFDEKVTSGEDTKLSVALRAQGLKIRMTKELNVTHLGNPITLKHFFVRQIWHSENYIQNWTDTKTDPTFYLLLIFLFSLVVFSITLFLEDLYIMALFFSITLSIPLIFTFKRLRRSKDILKNLRNFTAIYSLDFIYLLGRIFGLGKSILKYIATIIAPADRRVG